MRTAFPAALLVPLLLTASALDASGPAPRIVSAPGIVAERPGPSGDPLEAVEELHACLWCAAGGRS